MEIELIKFLQSCITPIALISGVGLVLLTLSNRLGRSIDRTRILVKELEQPDVKNYNCKVEQIQILYSRNKLIRNSIICIVMSMVCGALLIPILAFTYITKIDLTIMGEVIFIISILFNIVGLRYFISDIKLNLKALTLEAKKYI